MSQGKVLNFKDLCTQVSYDHEKRDSYSNRELSPVESKENNFQYDQHAHVKHIRRWVNDNDLREHVEIIELSEIQLIPERNDDYISQYLVKIQNAIIDVGREVNDALIMDLQPNDSKHPWGSGKNRGTYNGGFFIEFNDCTFRPMNSTSNCFCIFNLGANAYLKFHSCKFQDVDLYVGTKYEPGSACILELHDNKFENRHVAIDGHTPKNYTTGGWSLSHEVADSIHGARQLEYFINKDGSARRFYRLLEQYNRNPIGVDTSEFVKAYVAKSGSLKIKPEYVAAKEASSIIRVRGNEFTTIKIGGELKYYFSGRNCIDKLEVSSYPRSVFWGQYQIIDATKRYTHHHKSIFAKLKANAEAESNLSQSLIFQREIAICEREILRQEPVFASLQDRMILWFSCVFSNYGISWFRPISMLILVNLLIAIFLFLCEVESKKEVNFDFWYTFFELFNPLSNIPNPVGEPSAVKSFLNVIQKIFYATVIYDVVRTFRRFSRQR